MSNAMDPRVTSLWKAAIIAATVVVLCITLLAGLWPFAFHVRNGATWLGNANGLAFARFATARGTSPFESRDLCPSPDNPFALELWFEPDSASGYGTILAIGNATYPENFSIRQSLGDIEVGHVLKSPRAGERARRVFLDDVLAAHKKALLTLTTETGKTQYYVDGRRIPRSKDLAIQCGDLKGTLILGTSTVSNDVWSGSILGIAAYNRALTADEVKRHFAAWNAPNTDGLELSLQPAALYPFVERTGSMIRDAQSNAPTIEIPKNYTILRKRFLQPFWEEFSWDRAYAIDLAVNVIGFVPLGICATMLLARVLGVSRPAALSILLCFGTSLLIEVTQAYMPLRYSGTTDLITNTCGGAIGAGIYQIAFRGLVGKRQSANPGAIRLPS